jgi:large subunit ribosomal protein L15
MQAHQLQKQKQKKHRRIGRGGKRGTYSGRGMKGQNARSGSSRKPAILDLIRKIPKLRGVPASRYKKQGVKEIRVFYQTVNLDSLQKSFNEGDIVSPESLLEKKLVRKIKGRMPQVKILGKGELKKELKFEGVEMSKNVKQNSSII